MKQRRGTEFLLVQIIALSNNKHCLVNVYGDQAVEASRVGLHEQCLPSNDTAAAAAKQWVTFAYAELSVCKLAFFAD